MHSGEILRKGRTWVRALAVGVLVLGSAGYLRGALLPSSVTPFAVLGQFSNNQTNYNNGNIVGDVGIGSPRQFTISNANLTGNVRFSGAANTSGFLGGPPPNNVSGGGNFTGSIIANDPIVTSVINYTNNLGQTLGAQAGPNPDIAVTNGGSINASSGTLVSGTIVDGNPLGDYRLFDVTSVNFPNGTFTINGSATDQVVLDVGISGNFHGIIVLTGGITSDSVLINMFGGNYVTHTGGPTLDLNTNGLDTTGTWLAPNSSMSLVHSVLNGRFFGGDVSNQQIVSGANIFAPIPEPSTISLLVAGLVGGLLRRRTH